MVAIIQTGAQPFQSKCVVLQPDSKQGDWRVKKAGRSGVRKKRKEQWRTESVLVLWISTMLPLLGRYMVQFSRKNEGKCEMESTRLMLRILAGLKQGAIVTYDLNKVQRACRRE